MNTNKHRQDTIGCHNKIFFNNAGSSLMPSQALESMINYLQTENMAGGYDLAQAQSESINNFYKEVAILLNCRQDNIAFANSATDAYAKALSSIDFQKNDVIITTSDDYISNQIAFISLKKRFGIKLIRTKKMHNNELDFHDFEKKIKKYQPKLIAATHIPTNTGLVQNVEKIGHLCQKYKTLFLLDACQSVGQMQVDVQKIKCDFLTATGRKFLRGPRGTGFLFVSDRELRKNLEPLFIEQQGAIWTSKNEYKTIKSAKRFESWEKPIAAIIGFTTALHYLNAIGIKNIQKYNQQISLYFRQKLNKIPHLLMMDRGLQLSSIITVYPKDGSLEKMEHVLKINNICYSVATKDNAIIDFESKKVDWVIRFSPHYYNTIEEIDTVIDILKLM